jgi:hypothetical protein
VPHKFKVPPKRILRSLESVIASSDSFEALNRDLSQLTLNPKPEEKENVVVPNRPRPAAVQVSAL